MNTLYSTIRRVTIIFSLCLLISTLASVSTHREKVSANWLVFSGYQDDFYAQTVYITNIENRHIHQLLPETIDGSIQAVSPDGRWLFYDYVDVDMTESAIFRIHIVSHAIEPIFRGNWRTSFQVLTPDGQWIILDGDTRLARIRTNGEDYQTLVDANWSTVNFQTFSPDGLWIIFKEGDGDFDLYRTPINGGNPERLSIYPDGLTEGESRFDDFNAWSSDGQWFYYSHTISRTVHVGAILLRTRPDGSETQQLTPQYGYDFVTENADGSAIIVSNIAGPELLDLYRVDLATLDLDLISQINVLMARRTITISPDRQWGYYLTQRHGNSELYRVNFDTGIEGRVTKTFGDDGRPLWSPDGKWIVFSSQVDGYSKLFKARPDGSEMQMLTPFKQNEYANIWMTLPTYAWQPATLLIISLIVITLPHLARFKKRLPS